MSRDIFVIVNPAAGGGRASHYKATISEYFTSRRRSVEFSESNSSEDVRKQAARAAADGYTYVLALGGDGTFHHLVEGIRGTDAIAGFLPAGGGNDIARALDIPADPVRATNAFLHSVPRAIDLIRARFANGRIAYCVGAAGMGLDAEAAYLACTRFSRWPGAIRYVAGALWTYFRGAAFDLHAEIDGVEWNGRALFAVAANAGEYGSGVRIAPAATMEDGWLELVLVRDLPWMRLIEAIPIVLTSGDLRFAEVERFRCRRVLLEANRSARVHGDGELLGESPAEFEILPRALRVMAPKRREAQ